jgi:hypothetical protein
VEVRLLVVVEQEVTENQSGKLQVVMDSKSISNSVGGLPVTAQGYPITVGGGGAQVGMGTFSPYTGNQDQIQVFSTITSTGGGGGKVLVSTNPGWYSAGGSGGGAWI